MKLELFPFQKRALSLLRTQISEAMGSYYRTHTPQVVSFTAPTGAGKTLVMAALFESIFVGDEIHAERPDSIFVWLSDSPELNLQSKAKIDAKADKIRLNQCIVIEDESFDQEILEDGRIYFLNAQKLGKNSNLVKCSDIRHHTIWETLQNTAREKADRLYFVIDEAHRGMLGTTASKATTIMQKFIKGSQADNLDPIPLVIGMSATSERFNKLVAGTTSTIHKAVISAEEVRSSGLLKDRIVITYPVESTVNKDMAILQAAADEWQSKCLHWNQYCTEQHYTLFNPIFVLQVQNGSGTQISSTDLDDCLRKIEDRVGYKFQVGEVVHTFGQTSALIHVNGIDVYYVEPSRITERRQIKVVFFKENLSTGWDCPRAETMMSFRHANDATYIAQLLGRMVRTPLQMHINVDDTLNDVHLYLPYFDSATVKKVVEELQNTEGGDIPTDIYGEGLDEKIFDTLTSKPSLTFHKKPVTSSLLFDETSAQNVEDFYLHEDPNPTGILSKNYSNFPIITKPETNQSGNIENKQLQETILPAFREETDSMTFPEEIENFYSREEVIKTINNSDLLTYDVRSVKINNYLVSLFSMVHLLSQAGIYREAVKDITEQIVTMIHSFIEKKKASGEYDKLVAEAKQFKLSTQIFDAFGKSVDNFLVHDMFTTTDTDIDRQFRFVEVKLGKEGIGNAYCRKYYDFENTYGQKLDVIIFASDVEAMTELNEFAKSKFHSMNDEFRPYSKGFSEKSRRQYDSIVSDGDIISKHLFRFPETITMKRDSSGKVCRDHLFVDEMTGNACISLNSWESGVLEEERTNREFLYWFRNPPRKPWSLCIPYEIGGVHRPTYPDLLVIRKNGLEKLIVDILEPHDPTRIDNLGKAKGFAEYARQNPNVGRIQLIRKKRDSLGNDRFIRLDMSKSAIREKIFKVANNDELDHIFDTDGIMQKEV
ncbi:MAG: DEAD/DEAH box helicase family protein [Bacteroidales bacterium]|nr:DEAD/DEAH box helicase family protein [Bacteroidales bacterium]